MIESHARRPLYVMAKPPPDVAALIAALGRAGDRPPDRLHMTLAILGDRLRTPECLPMAIAAMEELPEKGFHVAFDRIWASAVAVTLRGSETMRGALRFQAALCRHLTGKGLPLPLYMFRPHITLRYRPDGRGAEAIDPISWRVQDVRLIESVVGEGRHVEHGRWALHDSRPAVQCSSIGNGAKLPLVA